MKIEQSAAVGSRVIEIPLFMPAVLADRERDLSASRIPYEQAIKSRARFEILATWKRRWRSSCLGGDLSALETERAYQLTSQNALLQPSPSNASSN